MHDYALESSLLYIFITLVKEFYIEIMSFITSAKRNPNGKFPGCQNIALSFTSIFIYFGFLTINHNL